jgi:hypothetical protein
MTDLEQLTAWAEQGFYVQLTINDGHEKDLGKPSYCLSVSNEENEYDLGDNDVHGSLKEAVAATLAAPLVKWDDEMIDMFQQAEVCQVNGETQLGIVGSNGTQMIIRPMTEEERETRDR